MDVDSTHMFFLTDKISCFDLGFPLQFISPIELEGEALLGNFLAPFLSRGLSLLSFPGLLRRLHTVLVARVTVKNTRVTS
jgi:hypothetical protein